MIPTVVLRITEDGYDLLASGDIRLLWVDETCQEDRVYEQRTRVSEELIASIIGDSPIGHSGDGRVSPNKEQAILAKLRPGLRVVE